jgi:prefoldin subunit 5
VIEKLATKDEHNILKQRVDNLEKLMKDMRNQLRAIEDRMKDLRAGTGSGVGADELENL